MKFALLLITISFLSTHSFAQDATGSTTTPPPATPTVPTSLDVTKGNPAIIKIIEDKFNLSADDIAKYRSEKLGYGQIMLMAEFAKSSEKSMDEVVALLKEKKSMKEVASELKISSEDMAKIRKEIRPLLREQNKDKKEETKEKKEKKNRKETDRDDDRKDDKKEERRNEQREVRKAERKEERREDKRDERLDDRQDDRKTEGHKK